MKLEGNYVINASCTRVYAAIGNPSVLALCVSNIKSIETESEGVFKVVLDISVGIVKGTLRGKIKLLNPRPNQAVTIKVEMQTPVGRLSGTGDLTLNDISNKKKEMTQINWSSKSPLGVLVAILGSQTVISVAQSQADLFFSKLEIELQKSEG